MSEIRVRALRDDERSAFLAINNDCVPNVNELDRATLVALLGRAVAVLAAERGGRLAGGLVGLGPDSDYASPFYRWFDERYTAFFYVDRVVVAAEHRRAGVGRALYEAAIRQARTGVPVLCEVNQDPPNPGSMAFHEAHGFRPVGRVEHPDNGKRVVMLERPPA